MTNLLKIATTQAQSSRLVVAGVSPSTSDMHFRGNLLVMGNYYPATISDISPAWSLSALWDILHRLDKTYEFDTKIDSAELMEHLVSAICYRFENR